MPLPFQTRTYREVQDGGEWVSEQWHPCGCVDTTDGWRWIEIARSRSETRAKGVAAHCEGRHLDESELDFPSWLM